MRQKVFLLQIVFLLSVIKIEAYDFASGGIYYNITSDNTVSVTYHTYNVASYSGSVNIPSSVYYSGKYYTVTEVGEAAFKDCKNLTSIYFPNTITKIGDFAFHCCYGLTSIEIPNSVTSIGYCAFINCSDATYINFPTTLTYLGERAFYGCVKASPVHNGVIFAYMDNRTKGSYNIPEGIQTIAAYAFHLCENITSVRIPSSVTKIENEAFYQCNGINSLTLPDKLKWIGDRAFYDCDGIPSLVIPNSVTHIGSNAFSSCNNITTVELPNSVTSMGSCPFFGCNINTPIYNDHLFVYLPDTYSGDYKIPDGIKTIVGSAFSWCSGMTSIEIPNSVIEINNSAFYGCRGLTSLVIPNSVTKIGLNAFINCEGLKSVVLPASVNYIDIQAFSYCYSLESFKVENSNPNNITLDSRVFLNSPTETCVLKVPTGSREAYANADQWSAFQHIEEFDLYADLVDKEPYSNKIDNDIKYLTYSREFASTNWQPLYIPFSMDYEEWNDWAEIAEINDIHQFFNSDGDLTETVVEFHKLKSGATKPNTPYVIRPKSAGEINLTFENKTLAPAANGQVDCSSAHWQYTLTGVYETYSDMVGKYALDSKGEFTRGTSDIQTLKPQRFYLEITPRDGGYGIDNGSMNAPAKVSLMVDGEATGIEMVATNAARHDGKAYSLQGQRVDEGYKGIVIINGKKILKK